MADAAAKAAGELTDITEAVGNNLTSLSLQFEKLKQCQAALNRHHHKWLQERSTQVELGPQINPLRHVRRLDHETPFSFKDPDRKINWKKLRQLDLQHLADSCDPSSIMAQFEDVAYGDVESGSIYELSEANLIKALEDDRLALAAGLTALSAPSLGDLHKGLGLLGADMMQLGSSKVDGLIEQVRGEERQAAKSALLQTIQKTRQEVEVKYSSVQAVQPSSPLSQW